MKLSNQSEVPVYTISGSNTARPLPEWLARRRKRSLKNDPEYANRVELLQDFEFEEASQCVRVSEDGEWVMSTGTYKPQIHTHYLPQLSLSWARHTVALNTTFILLSSDYSKSLHLQSDRSLEFHTPSGCHHTMRLPRYGRDLAYDRHSTEALVPSVGVNPDGMGEVFRLNLEMGRYMRSYEVDVGGDDFTSSGAGALQGGINTGAVNTAAIAEDSHNLLAFGTTLGTVELFDPRAKGRAGILVPPTQFAPDEARNEITALDFHRSGLTLATGASNGLMHLYDLRSPIPLLKKDQGYGFPIHTLKFLQPSTATREQTLDPKIMSSDKKIIKIWDPRDGSPWTSVEPAVDINSVAWCKDSGMLLTANEGRQQHSFFIPQLGPAPKWCSFLDNLVEEMAEDPNDPNAFSTGQTGTIYDNFKFLTVPQLRTLNLDHLIGRTNLLRPYMHGYFVGQQLYDEARLIANPYIWEEERAKRVKDKIDKERESRIRGKKKANVKVNKRLAEKLMHVEEKNERKKAQRVLERGGDAEMVDAPAPALASEHTPTAIPNAPGKSLLADSRFSKLFEDEDFAIDETSHEFRMLNPSTVPEAAPRKERGLTAVEQEDIDDVPGSSSDGSGSEQEGHAPKKEPSSNKISTSSYKRNNKSRQPRMQVSSSTNVSSGRDRSFGSRAQNMQTKSKPSRRSTVVGEQEVSFMPQGKQRQRDNAAPESSGRDKDSSFRAKERRSASGNAFRKM
ncbi:WD repeat NOL10/ENP2 family protein [Aspergillus ruber CBS 135680]|uniref:WD40 repeat-like protein n=1 Tax=Aspergillus ruber (strain CBS 135680) TaxID=1388766 RepID=A0A017S1W4_ASPRC|nr:WD40 repeat-like protein [Aspergillus ruber CBS 135680]EYE90942.1 WD40 repeat-like protein [Aspergillus ruber CBS 135680]